MEVNPCPRDHSQANHLALIGPSTFSQKREELVRYFETLKTLLKKMGKSIKESENTISTNRYKTGKLFFIHVDKLKESRQQLQEWIGECRSTLEKLNDNDFLTKSLLGKHPVQHPSSEEPKAKKQRCRLATFQNPEIINRYYELYEEREQSGDVLIKLQDGVIKAHQAVLIPQSSYFTQLLNEECPQEEVNGRKVTIISSSLESLTSEKMNTLLCFLYTHQLDFTAKQALEFDWDLLTRAQECGIQGFETFFLLNFTGNLDLLTMATLYGKARNKNIKVLEFAIRNLICLNAEYCLLKNSNLLEILDKDSFVTLLKEDILSLKESQVAEIVCKWLEIHGKVAMHDEDLEQENQELGQLIQELTSTAIVRLPLIDRGELYNWKKKRSTVNSYLVHL